MLRNFMAVMKDSFREAVDGFVIYVMLGLAVITIVVAASVSFEPNTPDEGFNNLVKQFTQVFQSRGTSNEEVATRIPMPWPVGTLRQPLPVQYSATDVQRLDGGTGYAGKYKLRVQVSESANPQGGFVNPFAKPEKQGRSSLFLMAVYAWSQAKPPEQYVLVSGRLREGGDKDQGPQVEVVPDGTSPEEALAAKQGQGGQWMLVAIPKVSLLEAASVTDETMCDFIKNQFLIHGSLEEVTVRRTADAPGGGYQFDVTATVPPGAKGWPHKTYFLFGAFGGGSSGPLGPAVYLVQDYLVNWAGASVILLVAVILTGFFIPNMLRKGSLDLIVSKPMARWELLVYKYLGGLIFTLLVSTVTIGGVWVALAVRSGNWNPAFLLSILFITFTFAVLYAVSTLVAMLTRNAIVAILLTCMFMVFIWLVGVGKSFTDGVRANAFREEDKTHAAYTVIDAANVVLPRYNDVLKLNSDLLVRASCTQPLVKAAGRGEVPSWAGAVGVSLAYIVGLLGLSYWRFATRDP